MSSDAVYGTPKWSKTVADLRPPLLTGCILRPVKILEGNALFWHKIVFKIPIPHPTPFRSSPYSKLLDPPLV